MTKRKDFIDHIATRPLLADGALGTYFYEKGIGLGTNTDLLNISDPDLVYSVHEEYIRAGSQLIETNTFGANRFRLGNLGKNLSVKKINLAGASIARKAAGSDIFVAGSIGPTGIEFPLDLEEFSVEDIEEAFEEQMKALLEGGVDLIMLETFTHLEELIIAIKTAKRLEYEVPVVAQMVFPAHGRTAHGLEAPFCAKEAIKAGCDCFGTNCGRGVKSMLQAIEYLSPMTDVIPLSAFPNAGIPEVIDFRMVYSTPPSYMAEKVGEMVRMGVRLVGGCCGTTPAHIHEFKKRLHLKSKKGKVTLVTPKEESPDKLRDTGKGPGALLKGLNHKRLPIFVELDPPPHLNVDNILQGAKALKDAGTDCITLAENPLAVLRADNLSLAHLIKKDFKIETVIHLTGRDRNVLALQTQVMGAHFLGIRGILAVTGDPASSSDQPGVSGVFDLNSFGLVKMISGFNQGLNLAGRDMKGNTDFSIGVAFSYRPSNPSMQLRRLEKKAALGAHFVMTQPIFDAVSIERLMELTSHLNMLILPGLFPLISARNAEFLHNELPGITIPEEIRKRLRRFEKVEDQRKEGIDIVRGLMEKTSDFVDGFYLISPLNKWEVPVELVKEVRSSGWKGSGKLASLCGEA